MNGLHGVQVLVLRGCELSLGGGGVMVDILIRNMLQYKTKKQQA